MEKSLEEQMLEAICQSHWQSNASDSKVAARKCEIIALRYTFGILKNTEPENVPAQLGDLYYKIEELESK